MISTVATVYTETWYSTISQRDWHFSLQMTPSDPGERSENRHKAVVLAVSVLSSFGIAVNQTAH